MMGSLNKFRGGIDVAWSIIDEANLGLARQWMPDYGRVKASTVRSMTHFDQWKWFIEERLYDFQLCDLSLLQFKPEDEAGTLSYCFVDSPLKGKDYFSWGAELLEMEVDEFRVEMGLSEIEDYERAAQSFPQKKHVTPIRYDFAPSMMDQYCHPAAHLHVGQDNEIRIGARKKWTPASFCLFVVRQCYPDSWREILRREHGEDAVCSPDRITRRVRVDLQVANPIADFHSCEVYLE